MAKYQIKKIDIEKLRPHEEICEIHLNDLLADIKKDGFLADPIIADKDTLVILDGHHRYNTLKRLGARFCPVCLVDYKDGAIAVGCWREGETITKDRVIEAGITGKLLRPQTSRHTIPDRPKGLDVPLEDLK